MKDMDVNKVSDMFRTIRELKKDNAKLERERDEMTAHVESLRKEWEKSDGATVSPTEKLERIITILYRPHNKSLAAHDAALLQELMDICDRLKYRDVSQSRYNAALGDIHAAAEMIGIQRGAFQSDAIERG